MVESRNIFRNTHLTFGSHVTPIDRIADILQKTMKPLYVCMGLTAGYLSVLYAGWNYSFPSRTEQILWCASCVTLMATLFALLFFAYLAGTSFPALHLQQALRQYSASKTFRTSNSLESGCRRRKGVNNALERLRNNSIGSDPLLYIPLKITIPVYVITAFYCHTRTYIFVADGIATRSLPASAYATVDWQKY